MWLERSSARAVVRRARSASECQWVFGVSASVPMRGRGMEWGREGGCGCSSGRARLEDLGFFSEGRLEEPEEGADAEEGVEVGRVMEGGGLVKLAKRSNKLLEEEEISTWSLRTGSGFFSFFFDFGFFLLVNFCCACFHCCC